MSEIIHTSSDSTTLVKPDDVLKKRDISASKKKSEKLNDPVIPFFSLWKFASPLDKVMIFFGTILSIGMGTLIPGAVVILGKFLNDASSLTLGADVDITTFYPTILIFVYMGVAMLLAGYFSQVLWIMSGENQAKRIRQKFLHSILRQDIGWFDKAEEGSLTTRLAQDTQLIQDGISEKTGQVIQGLTQFFAGFIIAFVEGWKMSLVTLASLPILAIVSFVMMKMVTKYVGKGQDAHADAGALAEQVISGIRTVYSFSLQDRFQTKYEEHLDRAYTSDVRKGGATGLSFGLIMFTMFSINGFAFWYGSRLVLSGEIDGGTVLVVFFAILMGATSLIALPQDVSAIGTARGAAYKVFSVIERTPQIDSFDPKGLKPEKITGRITFRDVKFAYPSRPDVVVLKNFSLEINPGNTVAFVGSSGSGKSTSISLLQRFYDPLEGKVCLDDVDLKSYNIKWLRRHIGVVGQEPVLFNATIRQNILMGAHGDVTESELIEVAKKANCHSFITKLPKGYDTIVGDHGGMLSGGQKQRIAIARALINNPRILLLDEATSALDTYSERIVQHALEAASQDRTTIVIAHRLSTIRNADVICVMNKGLIVEKGTHDELVAKRGVYYDLVEKQRILMETEKHTTGKKVDEILFENHMDDEQLRHALENEKVEILQQVRDENTNEVIETHLLLDDTAALKNKLTEKRRLEKESKKIKAEQKAPLRRVLMLMEPEWPILAIGCFAAIIAGIVTPVFGFIFTRVIVMLLNPLKAPPGPFEGTNLYAFGFVIIGLVSLFAYTMQTISFEIAGARMARRLGAQTFKSLMRQEIGFFDQEGNSLGALTSRLATDTSKVGEMVTKVWGDVVQLIATLVCGLTIAFINSWQLTLIVLISLPFIAVCTGFEARIQNGFEDATKTAYEESGEIAAEAIKEIRTVAALTRESYFEDKFAVNISRPHKLARRKALLASLGSSSYKGFNQFANALGFYAGLRLYHVHLISLQNMFTVIIVIMVTAQGLGETSTFVSNFAKAKYAALSTFELIDRASSIDPDTPGEDPEYLNGDFKFQNVKFTYPARPDHPIFSGKFNLEGKRNQTIALVGPSGCGKSTVIGLLERWYDRTGGRVEIDSKDVKSFQLKGLRKNMAVVGQEPILFDMTLRENILAGTDRTNVTVEELESVARMANIWNFLQELPDGFDTRVGDKGSQLSGGQKQRVAIARAIIRRPRMLLLDEATSALDSESEKLVQEALDCAIEEGERTTITIAHRLSSIQNSDKIFVVKDGQIVESGTHFELLAMRGVYSGLVQQQNLHYNK